MSGKIDYDELDRAVSQASKTQSSKATKIGTKDFIAEKQSYTPRTRYMDFIARPRKKLTAKAAEPKAAQVNTKPAPKTIAPQEPHRVARFAPASAGMPNYRIASSHPATKPHSIPTKPLAQPAPVPTVKPVAKAAPISAVKSVAHSPKPATIKTPAQPVITKPTAHLASAKLAPKTAQSESEKIQARNTATAATAAAKALEKAPSSPNANNYSLGVRSPFIRNDAKVEKRPLGSSSEYVQDDKVGKNTYEAEKPSVKDKDAKSKKSKKTKVARNKDQKSKGWVWPLIIVLIIAAGGGLGYLAYRVLENAF